MPEPWYPSSVAKKSIYGSSSPFELPVYAIPRAARIVRVSPSTLRLWAVGDGEHRALFDVARTAPPTLSFANLTEAFVLASMRRVHNLSMQHVRKALAFVGKRLGYARPLLHAKFRTDGVSLFADHAGTLLNVTRNGQAALAAVLEKSLSRIDWENDFVVRLYPWVRADLEGEQPKSIVVDPRRAFGQPVIADTGIEARIVAQRYRAGESVADLAKDYRVTTGAVEDAIRCETLEAA